MNTIKYAAKAIQTCNPDAWTSEHFIDLYFNEAAECHQLFKKRHYGPLKIDVVAVIEELGDLLWTWACFQVWFMVRDYDIALSTISSIPADKIEWHPRMMRGYSPLVLTEMLCIKAGRALEDKKNVYVVHTLMDFIPTYIQGMIDSMDLMVTAQDVADANLAKLAARYKGGEFSMAEALHRDKDAELRAIELKV